VVVAVGLTLTGVPLVTARLPGVMTPVPLTNVAVRLELDPEAIVVGFAVKPVTVVFCVTAAPKVLVTVRVYGVVAEGLTLTGVPLVTGIGPGVITPVPLAKTPVKLELPPGPTVVGLATKLVIVGAAMTVTLVDSVAAVPAGGVTVSV
jgi:hypothetical protein